MLAQTSANYTIVSLSLTLSLSLTCAIWLAYGQTTAARGPRVRLVRNLCDA